MTIKKASPLATRQLPIPVAMIENRIFEIRGHKGMLDSDLAELYEVETKVLNQAVRRNLARFPADFMMQLMVGELNVLRSQTVTSNSGRVGRRYLPYVFTEQGVAMLSTVLNNDRAINVTITIMEAFVQLREIMSANKELPQKLTTLEKKYDAQFKVVFNAIRKLMAPAPT